MKGETEGEGEEEGLGEHGGLGDEATHSHHNNKKTGRAPKYLWPYRIVGWALFLLCGSFVARVPGGLDPEDFSGLTGSMSPETKGILAASFLLFVVWLITAMLVIGSLFEGLFDNIIPSSPTDQLIVRLTFGFMGWCWFGLVLGALGLFRQEVLVLGLTTLGLASCLGTAQDSIRFSRWMPLPRFQILATVSKHPSGTFGDSFSRYGLALLLSYLFTRFWEGMTPQVHGDPLYYHLPSAWNLLREQKIAFYPWNPWYLQAGMGELFYGEIGLLSYGLVPFLSLPFKLSYQLADQLPNRMAMMILCQLIHGFFSYPAAALLIFKSARLLGIGTPWALVATLGAVTIPEGADALIAAKNDGFVWYFALTSLYLSLLWMPKASESSTNMPGNFKKLSLLAGIAAFSFSIKFTAAFYLLPWIFGLLIWGFLQPARLFSPQYTCTNLFMALGSLSFATAVASPILIRNGLMTGNPFFPALSHFFPSIYINNTMVQMIQSFTKTPGTFWEVLRDQGNRFFLAKPLYTCAVLGCLGIFLAPATPPSPERRRLKFLGFLTITSFILLVMITGRGMYSRFSFFLYGLLSLTGASFLEKLYNLTICRQNQLVKASFALFVGGAAIINGRIELPGLHLIKAHRTFMTSHQTWGQEFAQRKLSYQMHLWINQHPISGPILSLGDNENFFLDPPLAIPDNHVGAAKAASHQTIREISLEMSKQGFNYLLVPVGWNLPAKKKVLGSVDLAKYFTLIYQSPAGYQLFRRL